MAHWRAAALPYACSSCKQPRFASHGSVCTATAEGVRQPAVYAVDDAGRLVGNCPEMPMRAIAPAGAQRARKCAEHEARGQRKHHHGWSGQPHVLQLVATVRFRSLPEGLADLEVGPQRVLDVVDGLVRAGVRVALECRRQRGNGVSEVVDAPVRQPRAPVHACNTTTSQHTLWCNTAVNKAQMLQASVH